MNKFYKIGVTNWPKGNYEHRIEVDYTWGIASVLTAYDLPDLIASIAPRKVVLAGPVNSMLEPASSELIAEGLTFPRSVYSYKKAPDKLKVIDKMNDLGSVVDWGFE